MKALTWHGKGDIRCESVPDPAIQHGRDAIIKVTACAICGSDLHIFDGLIPKMESGDVLGHETMGEVVEVGADNKKLKVGDRVVVPITISCGECFFCKRGFYSACERSNPDSAMASKFWGHSPAGLFGYSHLLGGYSGGISSCPICRCRSNQSARRSDSLFLSDIFPTGYMAADFCNIQAGDTIAIWGCGPEQMAIRSAFLLGAERVIAIDTVPERLALARAAGALTLDFKKEDIYDRIQDLTNGRGADACIDAVGTESDTGSDFDAVVDRIKVATFMGTDRPHVLRQAIHCCRNFGTVSIVGVYGGYLDKIPMGSAINRGLTSAWLRLRCNTTCRFFWSAFRRAKSTPHLWLRIVHRSGPSSIKHELSGHPPREAKSTWPSCRAARARPCPSSSSSHVLPPKNAMQLAFRGLSSFASMFAVKAVFHLPELFGFRSSALF